VTIELTTEEARAIRAMQRLARTWPSSLWIFATGNPLTVLKCGDEGERVMTAVNGGPDPDFSVATVSIPNDGGDW
jgi:hypothetical protein